MFWLLLIGLVVLPALEFWIFLQTQWPLWVIVLWCAGAAGAGAWFARGESLTLWTEVESDLQNHRVPPVEVLDALLVQIGAWALIVPGLLTDALGLLLLVPDVRAALVELIRRRLRAHVP